MNTIFVYSATGNSLYAARILAEKLGDATIRPMKIPEAGLARQGGKGNTVGFVFPSHYDNLPRTVSSFVRSIDIHPETYIYCLVTRGIVSGGAVNAMKNALESKGLDLCLGAGVTMGRNYVMAYNPTRQGKARRMNRKASRRIGRIAKKISMRDLSVSRFPRSSSDRLYTNIRELDREFYATLECDGCGTCVRACIAGNISLKDRRPVWGGKCEHCAACISLCPKGAIQYGNNTIGRRRYANPDVAVSDILDLLAGKPARASRKSVWTGEGPKPDVKVVNGLTRVSYATRALKVGRFTIDLTPMSTLAILATDRGPVLDDLALVIYLPGERIVIPSAHEDFMGTILSMKEDYPVDYDAGMQAMTTEANDRYVLWRKPKQEPEEEAKEEAKEQATDPGKGSDTGKAEGDDSKDDIKSGEDTGEAQNPETQDAFQAQADMPDVQVQDTQEAQGAKTDSDEGKSADQESETAMEPEADMLESPKETAEALIEAVEAKEAETEPETEPEETATEAPETTEDKQPEAASEPEPQIQDDGVPQAKDDEPDNDKSEQSEQSMKPELKNEELESEEYEERENEELEDCDEKDQSESEAEAQEQEDEEQASEQEPESVVGDLED